MKRSLLVSTAAFAGLFVPVFALAAEYRPSEQNMIFASQQHKEVTAELDQAQRALQTLLNQRREQEVEYYNTFAALTEIREQLDAEQLELEEWIAEQIQEENSLLELIRIEGAPHNVLKVRSRQRQLANAKLLFGEQRDVLLHKLEEKEVEWQSQWSSLTESQRITRSRFSVAERNLRHQIERLQFKLSNIDSLRLTGRNENILRAKRNALTEARDAAYRQRVERRTTTVEKALQQAEKQNYFNTPNPEVVAQIEAERNAEIEYDQSMQLKKIMERLGIYGPVNDELRASLYLHLFGSVPVVEVEDEAVVETAN